MIVEFEDGVQIKSCWDSFQKGSIRHPNKHYHDKKFKDLTGEVFGKLLVLHIADYKNGEVYWTCQCLCDKHTILDVMGDSLRSGHTKSCGCLIKENNAARKGKRGKRLKENQYDLSNEYGIGYCVNTNNPFYFDKEDYDLIKQYTWSEKNNYVVTFYINKNIAMHRLVLNVNDPTIEVDHIGHNTMDNRKSKLRISNQCGNHQNLRLAKNNKSGVTGVCWESESNKWHSYIWHDGKTEHLGRFELLDDAIKARKDAENKYFGEYSYDNSMKIYQEGGTNELQKSNIS